jgi:predicted adenine nucleotide alpha hydrolase (AANH) superfamily ATPase
LFSRYNPLKKEYKILVHICCAVDSHYFLQKLQLDYPDEKLIGFFYNPNIHPYSEYYLRLLDVKRSCKILNIELIEGEYNTIEWFKAVKSLEKEKEKGGRCGVCFDNRFEMTAKKVNELGEKSFTSTLLISPKKSIKQLTISGNLLAKKYGIKFIAPNYKKASGTQEQNILAKKDKLYRQDYCGCIYGLNMQREKQKRLADELFSPISRQIQPESIEARIKLYEERLKYEKKGIEYKIIKQRFLNWRLKFGYLKVKKRVVASHFLPYSTLKKDYTRGRVENSINNVFYMNRDEVKFILLERYNQLGGLNYNSVNSLIFNPPPFQKELEIREKIVKNYYDLSLILIVKEIPTNGIEIVCESHIYPDVKEELLKV